MSGPELVKPTTKAAWAMFRWWLRLRTHPPSIARQREFLEQLAIIEADARAKVLEGQQ